MLKNFVFFTYTIQSTANNKDTSCVGVSMDDSTMRRSTNAALGTLADEKLAAVDVKLQKMR